MASSNVIKDQVKLLPFYIVSFSILFLLFLIPFSLIIQVVSTFDEFILHREYIVYALKTSFFQSILSSVIVLLLGILFAKSLFRRSNFIGRNLVFSFLNISYAIAPIIFAVGLVKLCGGEGIVASFIENKFQIKLNDYLYSVGGVIFVHVIINLPFAVRSFYNAFSSLSIDTLKLAEQIEFPFVKNLFLIQLPAIREAFAIVFSYVFIFSFTSFIIILILGGGVLSSTTIEVSIFEAIKLDFNVCFASFLSLIQFLICMLFIYFILKFKNNFVLQVNKDTFLSFNYHSSKFLKFSDFLVIFFFILICLTPLLTIIKEGISYKIIDFLYSKRFIYVLRKTLYIGFMSSLLSIFIAFSLISGAFHAKYKLKNDLLAKKILYLGNFKLIISTFVFVNGILLLSSNSSIIFIHAELFLILLTSLSSLPIVLNILSYKSLSFSNEEIWICRQLRIKYWNFVRYVFYPKIKKQLGFAFSFSYVFAIGDLNFIALVSSNKIDTLPNYLFASLRKYNFDDAAIVSFILLFVSLFTYWIINELINEN